MNRFFKHIPNFLTCCNLTCGGFGILAVFENDLFLAAYLMWLGGFFDFIDGFAARLTKSNSEFGKQLDSLADMISFSALPAFILLQLIRQAVYHQFLDWNTPPPDYHLEYFAFIVPVFSALRLAKFNLDTRQSIDFIGLPTPANAFFISSFPFIISDNILGLGVLVDDFRFLIAIAIIFSLLMVSEIRLFALKFKDFSFSANKIKYIFLLIAVALIVLFKSAGIFLIIILYITLSLIQNYLLKKS